MPVTDESKARHVVQPDLQEVTSGYCAALLDGEWTWLPSIPRLHLGSRVSGFDYMLEAHAIRVRGATRLRSESVFRAIERDEATCEKLRYSTIGLPVRQSLAVVAVFEGAQVGETAVPAEIQQRARSVCRHLIAMARDFSAARSALRQPW